MTTPNQPVPDNTPASQGLGDGAFEVGGGATDYGQGIDTNFVKNLFQLPAANLGNMLQILEQALLRLPMDVLSAFKSIVPDWVDDGLETIETVVGKIISALDPRKIPQYVEDFVEWVATVFTPVANLLEQVIKILGGVVVNPINAGIGLAQDLLSNLSSAVPALGQAIDSVGDFVQNVIAALIQGIRGIPLVGGTIADTLQGLTGAVKDQQVQAQNFTITSFTAGYRNPSWVCRYAIGDVTYPESQNLGSPAMIPVTQGRSFGSYITVSNTAVMDTTSIYAYAAGAVDNIFFEVFRENSDTSLTRLTSVNIAASLATSSLLDRYLEIALPTPIIAQAGERYLLRIRNSSSTSNNVNVHALSQGATSAPPIGFFPSSGNAALTSYTPTQALLARNAAVATLWMMLAMKNATDPDVSYSDDFNRANLGSFWYTSGVGNVLIAAGRASHSGAADGDENALYIRRTTDDASMVSGNCYVDEAATTQRFGLLLHASRDLSQFVYLSVSGTNAKIYSYTSSTLTERASVDVGGTDLYSLVYDEVNDKYVASKAGADIGLEWTGVSTAVTHSTDHRFGGIRITRASGVDAGTIDNWTLTDYA